MTALTKAFTVVADSAVDPDSPIDTVLITALRDNDQHLREWLGASYTAGAVQDHNHDGSNSAAIDVGPNYARNGSFESGVTGWTLTPYTGGTAATNALNNADGTTSLAFTSTVLANGGGDATQSGFTAVSGGEAYPFRMLSWASAINISSKAEVIWYDEDQAQISVTTLYTSTNTETAIARRYVVARAPASARYMKLKLTGGIPATGSATGTVYFDGVVIGVFGFGSVEPGSILVASSDAEVTETSTSFVKKKEIQVPLDGLITVSFDLNGSGGGSDAYGRIYINGTAAGTQRQVNSGYSTYTENIQVNAGDLLQVYARHAGGTASVRNFRLKSLRPNVYMVNL